MSKKSQLRRAAPPVAQTPADVQAAATRATAVAAAKKVAADAVRQHAEQVRHTHEATQAEADRHTQEHAAHDKEAQRLAADADALARYQRPFGEIK